MSEYCTHGLAERRTLGWDLNGSGHAVCRGCGKAAFQSVEAARAGQRAAEWAPASAASGSPASVLIVTTNEVAGYRIDEVHGDVFGLIVRARNVFSNLGASLRSVVGGEVAGYTKLLNDSRIEARARLADEARKLGGNAVVAMRFDCNEIGDIMSEVAAYGTAVTISKLPAEDSSSWSTRAGTAVDSSPDAQLRASEGDG